MEDDDGDGGGVMPVCKTKPKSRDGKEFRRIINHRLIENHPLVVQEMKRYYRLNGRPQTVAARGRLALVCWLRYGLLKQDPMKRRDKTREKLIYPESKKSQTIKKKAWLVQMDQTDTVIFDAWQVLLQPLMNREQICALAEVTSGNLSLDQYMRDGYYKDSEDGIKVMELAADLTIDNPYMHVLYDEAKKQGKNVLIRNSSEWISDDATDKALCKWRYDNVVSGEMPAGALLITADIRNGYAPVSILGEDYRTWAEENVITAIYDGIVNLKLHGK